jgi:hypothetical protein
VAVRKKSMRGLNCRGKNVCFFAAVQYIYGPFWLYCLIYFFWILDF